MPLDFQVVVDCSTPHVLADWWADALGWAVEPSDEDFIRRIDGALAGHVPPLERRLQLAREHTYTARTKRMLALIDDTIAAATRGAHTGPNA